MVYLFLMTLVIMIAEYFISARWISVYFRYGIPVYTKYAFINKSALKMVDEVHLNSLSPSFKVIFLTPLVFKKIAIRHLAFRQHSAGKGIMHGILVIDEGKSNVRLIAFINWWIVLLLGTIILISVQKSDFIIIAVAVTFLLLAYFLEKKMYDQVIHYLTEK